jgi:processive 1,2-diacylglycerol beta-glucosyltransferase
MAAAVTTSLEISLMNAPSALIVSASAGTGHVSAGRALHAAFESAGCAQVVHVDVLDLAPRWVRAAYGGGFELLASRAPGVWREVYRRSDGHTDDARWGTIARRLIFREFERLLTAERWSFCVCTHFLPAQLAAGRPNVPPFASVVTDFALHRYWVQPRVSQYFVATPDMARDLHARLPQHASLRRVSPSHLRSPIVCRSHRPARGSICLSRARSRSSWAAASASAWRIRRAPRWRAAFPISMSSRYAVETMARAPAWSS